MHECYLPQGMFRSGMQECNSDVIFLGSSSLTRSSSVTPGILKILVDFTFEESLPLTEDNVSDILHAANMYQFPKVEERCAEFLWKILDSSNCFQVCVCHYFNGLVQDCVSNGDTAVLHKAVDVIQCMCMVEVNSMERESNTWNFAYCLKCIFL